MNTPPTAPNPNDRTLTSIQHSSFAGPLPPPDVLKRYDEVAPGAAERIIAMAESQAKHRQELERMEVSGDNRRADRGQRFGLTIGVIGLLVALALGVYGNPWVAGIIGFLDIGGLVGVFVYGSIARRIERQRKRDILIEAVHRTMR